jgi:hypothetical protein
MSSAAKLKFDSLIKKAQLLSVHAGQLKRKQNVEAKIVFLHAALTTQVAAWDVYVKAVALEYFLATSDATNPKFMAMHAMLQNRMTDAARKLNTPNSENCRNYLMIYTGFDPWPHWINIKFGSTLLSNSLMVRERVNEILTLRHSFAHGLSMPTHSWNTNPGGTSHLSCLILQQTGQFITNVCKKTDDGLSQHISVQHSISKPW